MKWFYAILVLLIFTSCQPDDEVKPLYRPALMEVPKGFPEIDFPEGNEFTKSRWDLGKRLFYDPVLSRDNSLSCASCHSPELAFSDDTAFSIGSEGRLGTRNSPTLANVAYHPYLTREGGVPTLEMQVLVPIQEHNEFDFNIVLITERLRTDSSYQLMAKEAYDREVDPFVITRAIACFERSLLSGYSPFDQYKYHEDQSALSPSEINGMKLFFSAKTNCSKCHDNFNFTNYEFENNGLYEIYEDEGKFRLSGEESDRALFKVPSLRNIELTAPYMHDGSISTLEEVIEHYQSGGKPHQNKSAYIKPLDLSETEKSDLVQFLKTLTDDTFISNPMFAQ